MGAPASELASAAPSLAADLGKGALVAALGAGFAASEAQAALARCFRVTALEGPDGSPEVAGKALAAWVERQDVAEAGLLGVGDQSAAVLWAAHALGEKAKAVVLVSPSILTVAPKLPEKVETPVAVLVGSRDESQPPGALARYRKLLRGCHTVLVFDAGADIAGDRPQALAAAAGDFLERQGRFIFKSGSVALEP
jgi:pimeloyl-ACP methyl ester carboxylesterase